MKYFYDFHIHTVLSPCGDDEMTPNNIVGMAKISGLDVIAITDHNSVGNAEAVMQASKREDGPLVIPGMELETSEEVHILLLFEDLRQAKQCEIEVEESRFKIKNKPHVYGKQLFMDSMDNVVGEQTDLLVVSTSIGVYDCVRLADKYGGVALPAHVDKQSNGIIAILGGLNKDMGFNSVEVSRHCSDAFALELEKQGYKIFYDSDTHYLDSFNEREKNFLELDTLNIKEVISNIKQKIKCRRET